jgi:hypothetical protein
VFQQAFIPRKLDEVTHFERDRERLAAGHSSEGIYYQVRPTPGYSCCALVMCVVAGGFVSWGGRGGGVEVAASRASTTG